MRSEFELTGGLGCTWDDGLREREKRISSVSYGYLGVCL